MFVSILFTFFNNEFKKYDAVYDIDHTFYLYDNYDEDYDVEEKLVTIGPFVLFKDGKKGACSWTTAFDYDSDSFFDQNMREFEDRKQRNNFIVRRILVLNMYENNELKWGFKKEKLKEEEEHFTKIIKEIRMDKFCDAIPVIMKDRKLNVKRVIYSSDVCDTAAKLRLVQFRNIPNMLFLCTQKNAEIISGGFVSKQVQDIEEWIYDPEAFIFEYFVKDQSIKYFESSKLNTNSKSFKISKDSDISLFRFGKETLSIPKCIRMHPVFRSFKDRKDYVYSVEQQQDIEPGGISRFFVFEMEKTSEYESKQDHYCTLARILERRIEEEKKIGIDPNFYNIDILFKEKSMAHAYRNIIPTSHAFLV